jgi:hypothetical protein
MSETNYKVSCTSLEIKDPDTFLSSLSTETASKFSFEMSSKTQTKKDMGSTRTVYHGQSIINTTTTNVIPFWQYNGSQVTNYLHIGKIVLHISYLNTVDNSGVPQMLQLVGTQESGSDLTTNTINTTTTTQGAGSVISTLGTTYSSNFYLDGVNTNTSTPENTTQTWIIDLNKKFKSTDSTTNFIALGLKFNIAPSAATTIKIDAYTEVISV